jgi:hypothetical protein
MDEPQVSLLGSGGEQVYLLPLACGEAMSKAICKKNSSNILQYSKENSSEGATPLMSGSSELSHERIESIRGRYVASSSLAWNGISTTLDESAQTLFL